jgi:ethanolamine ammonia-lyase small subunit
MKVPAAPPPSLAYLRDLTPARVGLGRAGASLPTRALLDFTLDHARARDAVHAAFDVPALVAGVGDLGFQALSVASRAVDRKDYLRRPDLGRQLDQASVQLLTDRAGSTVGGDGRDVAIVIGDGLSPKAIHAHAVLLLRDLAPRLAAAKIEIGHVMVASGSARAWW